MPAVQRRCPPSKGDGRSTAVVVGEQRLGVGTNSIGFVLDLAALLVVRLPFLLDPSPFAHADALQGNTQNVRLFER